MVAELVETVEAANGFGAPIDQDRAPLVEALRRQRLKRGTPFAAPGHKRGAGASAEARAVLGEDAFAADAWLGVAAHDPAQRAAEDLAAATWGADRAFFLVNGSSSGTQAFLLGTVGPGDEVVVARDAHQSLLAGLVMTGATPVWVMPRLHPESGIGLGVEPEAIAAALDAHPRARLVVLTSPSYYGVASDVAGIVEVAHARGVPVYVDEAWGAHLPFHPALPAPAMACGADGAVTSTHKLLATLRQGSLLLAQGARVDAERVAMAVRLTQTTSPSLPILASLDACRRQMVAEGEALLERAIGLAFAARRRLAALPGLSVLGGGDLAGAAYDPTRLVIDVRGLGLTGIEAERALRRRYGVAPAMADPTRVVCVLTLGDTSESVDRLIAAFAALAAGRQPSFPAGASATPASPPMVVAPGPQVCTPRQAFFARARAVPLAAAVGAVAAELVVPYPPGIPALVPGEVVSAEAVAFLRSWVEQGLGVRGPVDPALRSVRVVAAS